MPTANIIDLLFETIPPWLNFPQLKEHAIWGYAAPEGTYWKKGPLHLTIQAEGQCASVRETKIDRLPKWCPELHLNSDRTFCLGLQHLMVSDSASAKQWWADLEVHLRLLSVALKTRVWPQHSALDHGIAGMYQFKARRLADKLNLKELYARTQFGETSWISDLGLELISAKGDICNVRQPCPCGCTTAKGVPNSFKRCSRRHKITSLILLERARRLELADFWATSFERGSSCCGMMRDCPLAAGSPCAPSSNLLVDTRKAVGNLRKFPV